MNGIRVAVDIGGTFTDLVYIDGRDGRAGSAKVPSTPKDPKEGVLKAVEQSGVDLSRCEYFLHGTTIGLNAFIQRRGAKTALITTKGFRDVVEIARMSRDNMYNWWYKRPPPIVPRPYRYEVTERIDSRGRVIVGLNLEELEEICKKIKQEKFESVAVCLINSYANPEHEIGVRDFLQKNVPDLPVSISTDITREYREYERSNTVIMDAYLKPLLAKYLNDLESALRVRGFEGRLMISLSAGGLREASSCAKNPILAFNSGPSGGVVGAVTLARKLQIKNMIAIDAGGTSFDASLILNYMPQVAEQLNVDGYPVMIPSIDIHSIGAGGGSIAYIDQGGHLKVGPKSAGADPGPICYGKGGTEPTVTDAAVVCGIINPDYFLGGSVKLERKLAEEGIRKLSFGLDMRMEDTASAILEIAVSNMVSALREITVAQGRDPREFTLLSYGGATSMFAARIAKEMGIERVVIPREPGNFSAWGMLFMDIVYEISQTLISNFTQENTKLYSEAFAGLEAKAISALKEEGVSHNSMLFLRFFDLRYEWQAHHLRIQAPKGKLSDKAIQIIAERFTREYKRNFGHVRPNRIQTVNLRIRALGVLRKPPLNTGSRSGSLELAYKGKRKVYDRKRGYMEHRVFERELLPKNTKIKGPAIIEEATTTVLIPENSEMSVDRLGNLILRVF
jgi:N-methylhydantoinase A